MQNKLSGAKEIKSGRGVVARAGIIISSFATPASTSGIEEAPIDGTPYVRQDGGWLPEGDNSGSLVPVLNEPGSSGSFMHTNDSLAHYPGETFPVTSLYYAGVNDEGNVIQGAGGRPTAGTWELRGYLQSSSFAAHSFALFTRIDTISRATMGSNRGSSIVRNPAYVTPDNSMINCEIYFRDAWHPFTASPNDPAWWGREIYNAAITGEYGPVTAYE